MSCRKCRGTAIRTLGGVPPSTREGAAFRNRLRSIVYRKFSCPHTADDLIIRVNRLVSLCSDNKIINSVIERIHNSIMTQLNTSFMSDIETADLRAQYDAEVKKILANKEVLAWVLQYCVDEFKGMPLQQIIPCIEGEPGIGEEPVYPGQSGKIFGGSNEDKVPNEGEVYFDIVFYAKAPGRESVKVYVNVEAQRDYEPGYDLVTRAVFYCARLLSKQLGVEFTPKDYDDIKKVYSIWICMNAPESLQNTISSYQMNHEALYGSFEDHSRYDLLEAVMIRLGKPDDGSELHRMLNVLLSSSITPEEKEKRLSDEFHMDTASGMKEEMDIMCNLSLDIEEKAMARGEARGEARGVALGEERMARLLRILPPDSKDFKTALSTNTEGRNRLYEKYNIT